MGENILKFYMDEASRPVKEPMSLTSMDTSLFKDQYFLALRQIESYLSALKRINGKDDIDLDSVNNIFAFIGDRGSGKTSCMVSLREFLIENATDGKAELDKTKFPYLHDVQFFSLDLIDPTYFDKNNDLLSLFLAKLYLSFQKLNKEKRDDLDENKRMAFLSQIAKTYKHLNAMTKDNCHADEVNIENLVALSSAVDLKQDIREVVDAYIDYFDFGDHMLLLCIDDIDLNASQAVQMLEYIRKYFVQPNILVMMALKLEQMEQVLKDSYHGLYHNEQSCLDDNSKKDVFGEMVERYLSKLIPHSQRIYMPVPEDYFNKELHVYEHRYKNEKRVRFENANAAPERIFTSVRQAVPELIFNKARYLFYNSESTVNYIVPRNFRNFRSLLKMLWTLKDYKEDCTEENSCNYYNKDVFKQYFFETWVKENLTQGKQEIVKKLITLDEQIYLNKYVVKMLYNTYYGNFSENVISQELLREIHAIVDDNNYFYNVSVGDTLGMIDDLAKRFMDDDDQKFFFFLRSLYSMRLYESYDYITEKTGSKAIKRYTQGGVVKKDQYKLLNEYEKVAAGHLFNSKFYNIFSRAYIESTYLIDTEKIAKLMYAVVMPDEMFVTEHNKVQFIEFIMLAVSGNVDSVTNKDIIRANSKIGYLAPIQGGKVEFDLLSIFFNLPRIMECYERFRGLTYNDGGGNIAVGEMFLDKIFSNNPLYADNLWFKFRKWAYESKIGMASSIAELQYEKKSADDVDNLPKWKFYDRWQSCCCFRNTEVMQDFIQQLENRNLYAYDKPLDVFRHFFEFASDYEIQSYDKMNDGSRRVIEFGFFDKLRALFGKLSESDLNTIFKEYVDKPTSDELSSSK